MNRLRVVLRNIFSMNRSNIRSVVLNSLNAWYDQTMFQGGHGWNIFPNSTSRSQKLLLENIESCYSTWIITIDGLLEPSPNPYIIIINLAVGLDMHRELRRQTARYRCHKIHVEMMKMLFEKSSVKINSSAYSLYLVRRMFVCGNESIQNWRTHEYRQLLNRQGIFGYGMW